MYILHAINLRIFDCMEKITKRDFLKRLAVGSAARLGSSVAIVEQQGCFGGVATNSMVNIWHSLLDTEFKRKIIGGLTDEIVGRLQKRDAVIVTEKNESSGFTFNS